MRRCQDSSSNFNAVFPSNYFSHWEILISCLSTELSMNGSIGSRNLAAENVSKLLVLIFPTVLE